MFWMCKCREGKNQQHGVQVLEVQNMHELRRQNLPGQHSRSGSILATSRNGNDASHVSAKLNAGPSGGGLGSNVTKSIGVVVAYTSYNARTVSAANLAAKVDSSTTKLTIRTRVCSAAEIADITDMRSAAGSNVSSYNYIGATPTEGSMGQAIKAQPSAQAYAHAWADTNQCHQRLSQNAYTTDDYISKDEGDLEKPNFQIAMVNPEWEKLMKDLASRKASGKGKNKVKQQGSRRSERCHKASK